MRVRMISKAALSQAEILCGLERRNFASVGSRCASYLRVSESILGPFEKQADADRIFLMLIRSELDHSDTEDGLGRSQTSWAAL